MYQQQYFTKGLVIFLLVFQSWKPYYSFGNNFNMPFQRLQTAFKSQRINPKYVKREDNFGQDERDKFLWKIMGPESNFGNTLEHPRIKHGSQEGFTASGRFAVIPPTALQMANKLRNSEEYNKLSKKTQQDLEYLSKLNIPEKNDDIDLLIRDRVSQDVKRLFDENPQLELEIARKLVSHIGEKQANEEPKMAAAWNRGHNLDYLDKDKQQELYKKKPHVQEYVQNVMSIPNKYVDLEDILNK